MPEKAVVVNEKRKGEKKQLISNPFFLISFNKRKEALRCFF